MVLEYDKILFLRTDQRMWCSECGVVAPKDGDFRVGRIEAAKRQNYNELKVPVIVECNERIQGTKEFQWVYIIVYRVSFYFR
jgi:hypothetical protein